LRVNIVINVTCFDIEFVGAVGAGNPWEALHKTRFDQPRVGMVALTVLDIVAYIQDLPVKQ
jgi:hypothetical protein